jgi:transmembrane sensor
MSKLNDVDELLMAKFLSGEANPEEAMQLHDWIHLSSENLENWKKVEGLWMIQSEVKYSSPDKSEAKQIILGKVDRKSNQINYKSLLRVAAVVLMLIVSVVVLYIQYDPIPLAEKNWITQNSLDKLVEFKLSEGTTVVLNKNSGLEYPQQFDPKQRNVVLHGEAYFDVVSNPKQPFMITCNNIQLEVIGTSFNVRSDQEKKLVELQVIQGKVKMFNDTDGVIVEAGWKGVYQTETKQFTIEPLHSENEVAYATKKFVFESAKLSEVIQYLEDAYNVDIVLENSAVSNCQLTSSFEGRKLSLILEVISKSMNLNYEIHNKKVIIRGDGCV